jgi:hypothetical protein
MGLTALRYHSLSPGEQNRMPLKAYEALGLGIPFMFAAATYGFFNWLDKNASVQARRAVSGWFRGEAYAKINLSAAIVAAFDKLYTSPLLRFRTFGRSVMVSIFVYVGCAFLLFMISPTWRASFSQPLLWALDWAAIVISMSLGFILMDYISLFVVRRCLSFTQNHLILPLIVGFLGGVLVVILIYILSLNIMLLFILTNRLGSLSSFPLYTIPVALKDVFYTFMNAPEKLVYLAPMFLVHLWLLLFALGALGTRCLYPIFRAVVWAQWFLKQGDQHPMRAIGMVSAALMFIGGAIWKAVSVI